MENPGRKILNGTIALGAIAVLAIAVRSQMENWREPTRLHWNTVAIGQDASSVRIALGPPRFSYNADDAPPNYYVDGYARRERPISGRVFIYQQADLICYIWFDQSGLVEEVFIGPG